MKIDFDNIKCAGLVIACIIWVLFWAIILYVSEKIKEKAKVKTKHDNRSIIEILTTQYRTGAQMLTKKDFKAIADIINYEYTRFDDTSEDDVDGKIAIKDVAIRLADYLTTQNPRFDRYKFLTACGVE
jgi:hypothetical protein